MKPISALLFSAALAFALPVQARGHHGSHRSDGSHHSSHSNSHRSTGALHGHRSTGTARSPDVRALNHLKNRTTSPGASDFDPTVTLKAMIAPGDDRSRWSTQHAAVIEGYVASVMVGGVETTNCGARKPADRDTHIELTLDPMNDSESQHVIVEVTPRVRAAMAAQGKDWNTDALRSQLLGHWVRVTGWLLFDREHATQSVNTAGSRSLKVWRATAWELHPVTAIKVLAGKP